MKSDASARIDVCLDQVLMEQYMTNIPPLKVSKDPIPEIIKLMDTLSDADATAEELKEAAELILHYQGIEEENFEIPTIKLKDEAVEIALIDQINLAVSEFEDFIKSRGCRTFEQMVCNLPLKYYKIKIFGENKRKTGFYLRENFQTNCVDVFMKNFFETHGNWFLIYLILI